MQQNSLILDGVFLYGSHYNTWLHSEYLHTGF